MKKIFAKELAALAVLALAFTGCNTAFDGTTANYSEKEAEYTDRSGATQTVNDAGSVTCTSSINNTDKKNVVVVTVTSFSKINLSSADEAIHFQHLTNNTANATYYPIRGADLPKTRIKVSEGTGSGSFTTTITYEVDGTGVTANQVALFVDATKLKTKGGTPVLAGDGNLTRGEVSDSKVIYLNVTNAGTTTLSYLPQYAEDFAPTYDPTRTLAANYRSYFVEDASGKSNGVIRVQIGAANKAKPGESAAYEADLKAKLDEAVVLQVREPGSREYTTKKLSFTYHNTDTASTTGSDPYQPYAYTADFGPLTVGAEYRIVQTKPEGIAAPAWYKEVYGHEASYYYGTRAGAKSVLANAAYTLHATVPSYIVVDRDEATTGPDATSSYAPYSSFEKGTATTGIRSAQKSFFHVTSEDNWFQVTTTGTAELDPAAAKDFIVVDANNKKIDADVDVITYSYNDSNTLSGKVRYVKITVKDVRYRNYTFIMSTSPLVTANDGSLKVLVGSGTKIKENKKYPAQLTFGQWKDVADDDASGYVQIN